MLQRIVGILPHPQIVAFGVDVAFETVLVFALLATQLAEVLQSA
jgi:hypothetical protein